MMAAHVRWISFHARHRAPGHFAGKPSRRRWQFSAWCSRLIQKDISASPIRRDDAKYRLRYQKSRFLYAILPLRLRAGASRAIAEYSLLRLAVSVKAISLPRLSLHGLGQSSSSDRPALFIGIFIESRFSWVAHRQDTALGLRYDIYLITRACSRHCVSIILMLRRIYMSSFIIRESSISLALYASSRYSRQRLFHISTDCLKI